MCEKMSLQFGWSNLEALDLDNFLLHTQTELIRFRSEVCQHFIAQTQVLDANLETIDNKHVTVLAEEHCITCVHPSISKSFRRTRKTKYLAPKLQVEEIELTPPGYSHISTPWMVHE